MNGQRRAGVRPACALACTLAVASLLAGCAGAPAPPGAQADQSRLATATVPGQATKASVLAALGPTRTIAFDTGYEVWLYQAPRGGAMFSEYVVLFDPKGVVSKVRQGAPVALKKE